MPTIARRAVFLAARSRSVRVGEAFASPDDVVRVSILPGATRHAAVVALQLVTRVVAQRWGNLPGVNVNAGDGAEYTAANLGFGPRASPPSPRRP